MEQKNSIIAERLQRINDFLILNIDFVPIIGLSEGKMGICIYLFKYASVFENQDIFQVASDLLDEIIKDLSKNNSVGLKEGLAGIAWGIEELVQEGIVEFGEYNILEEINLKIDREHIKIESPDNMYELGGILNLYAKYLKSSRNENLLEIKESSGEMLRRFNFSDVKIDDLIFNIDTISQIYNYVEDNNGLITIISGMLHKILLFLKSHGPYLLNPIYIAAKLLQIHRYTNLPELKEVGVKILEEYEEEYTNFIKKSNKIFSSVTIDIWLSYETLKNADPIMDLNKKIDYWKRLTLYSEPESIAGFNIDHEVQNWRVFSKYASQASKLLQFLRDNSQLI